MAQTGFTPIVTYNTATATTVPSAANLAQGELAVNVTDKKLYTKDSGGNVVLLASNGGDATGPASSTNLAIPTFSGTGGKTLLNNSGVTITAGVITATGFSGPLTGNASTVTTNANLTGPITSVGNATSIASQTGTGTTFAMSASPTFTGTVGAADLTTTGNTILGNASTDTLNVGNGGLIKDASGNVLIGTASPIISGRQTMSFDGNTYNGLVLSESQNTSNTTFLIFYNQATTAVIGSVGRVGATAAVIYNTTSDERLKSNIVDATPVLDKLMAVKVRQYDWTEGNLHQDYGFIAQELEPVLSGIVTKGKTVDDIWQLDYSRLTPHLVKAFQEQQALITSLTARLDILESK
jgi:hypothetical protein